MNHYISWDKQIFKSANFIKTVENFIKMFNNIIDQFIESNTNEETNQVYDDLNELNTLRQI